MTTRTVTFSVTQWCWNLGGRRKQLLVVLLLSVVLTLIVVSINSGEKNGSLPRLRRMAGPEATEVENTPEFFRQRVQRAQTRRANHATVMSTYSRFYNKLGVPWSGASLTTLEEALEEVKTDTSMHSDLLKKAEKLRSVYRETRKLPGFSNSRSSTRSTKGSRVTIATVACGKMTIDMMVMLKSAVLFSRESDLHVVIFSDNVLPVLAQAVTEFKWGLNAAGWDFTFEFHESWFPETEENVWQNMYELCATQRLFFPSLLPHVDSVLYLDADVIVVSNLTQMWNMFNHMNSSQLAAMSPNTVMPANGFYNKQSQIPYYEPRGLNAGIMLMNLTRMRDFNLEKKSMAAYELYQEKIKLADQDIYNIIFHTFPEKLLPLSCTYNFMWAFCGKSSKFISGTGLEIERTCIYERKPGPSCFCQDATRHGVNIVHGNSLTFHTGDYPLFKGLYDRFLKFNLLKDSFQKLVESLTVDFEILDRPCFKLTAENLYGNAIKYFADHGLKSGLLTKGR